MSDCSSSRDATRLVLDTNACLDLFVFGDPRCAALSQALADGALQLVTRDDCRAEWRRVLRYPVLRLDAVRCEELERRYDGSTSSGAPASSPTPALPRCSDPDDQKFLELARDARAAALVTRDAALLVLDRRMQRDHGVAILPPEAIDADWLRDIAARTRA